MKSNIMNGVITDIVDCPQCGLPAQVDEYYVVEEERLICEWCGYTHTKTHEGIEANKGYGSIHYVSKEGVETAVSLKLPLSLIERNQVIILIQAQFDEAKSSLYVWDDEANKIECLVGKKTKTLSEHYEEEALKARLQWCMDDASLLGGLLTPEDYFNDD